LTLQRVPDRERPLAVEAMDAVRSELLIEMQQHLGIAGGREPMPFCNEHLAQLDVVEDLAVVGDPEALVFSRHGLLPVGDVDDAQARVTQADFAVDQNTAIVGSAVAERPDHPLDVLRIDWLAVQAKRPSY